MIYGSRVKQYCHIRYQETNIALQNPENLYFLYHTSTLEKERSNGQKMLICFLLLQCFIKKDHSFVSLGRYELTDVFSSSLEMFFIFSTQINLHILLYNSKYFSFIELQIHLRIKLSCVSKYSFSIYLQQRCFI